MSFYYSFLDEEYQEKLNKDRERMLDLYCSYLEIENVATHSRDFSHELVATYVK